MAVFLSTLPGPKAGCAGTDGLVGRISWVMDVIQLLKWGFFFQLGQVKLEYTVLDTGTCFNNRTGLFPPRWHRPQEFRKDTRRTWQFSWFFQLHFTFIISQDQSRKKRSPGPVRRVRRRPWPSARACRNRASAWWSAAWRSMARRWAPKIAAWDAWDADADRVLAAFGFSFFFLEI